MPIKIVVVLVRLIYDKFEALLQLVNISILNYSYTSRPQKLISCILES